MERRAVTVEGIVQGVGFRPFVYSLAARLDLVGFVQNQSGRVRIEVEGNPSSLERFVRELHEQAPPLARIDAITSQSEAPRGETKFRIEASDHDGDSPIFISPDVATCPDCLAELFDPSDRHYRYPFLNCTNCGPRLTIIEGAPTIGDARRWPRFQCVPIARPSTPTLAIAAFTPNRPPAPLADRDFRFAMPTDGPSNRTIRW